MSNEAALAGCACSRLPRQWNHRFEPPRHPRGDTGFVSDPSRSLVGPNLSGHGAGRARSSGSTSAHLHVQQTSSWKTGVIFLSMLSLLQDLHYSSLQLSSHEHVSLAVTNMTVSSVRAQDKVPERMFRHAPTQ